MDSGGASGVPTSDASPQLVAELKAAKQSAAAAQSERDHARRALGQAAARRARTPGSASDPSNGRGKGASRGGSKKRAKKGKGKGTC